MGSKLLSPILWGTLLTGCVTFTVHWPEKELEEAADEIVEEVHPEIDSPTRDFPADRPDDNLLDGIDSATGATPGANVDVANASVVPVNFVWVRAAYADDQAQAKSGRSKLKTSSPKINRIKATIKARFAKLSRWYDRGALGEGFNGMLHVRTTTELSLKEKQQVRSIARAENHDRKRLYAEIAHENKLPSAQLSEIAVVFGRSWQKGCKTGWWIEPRKGKWEKKKPPQKGKTRPGIRSKPSNKA